MNVSIFKCLVLPACALLAMGCQEATLESSVPSEGAGGVLVSKDNLPGEVVTGQAQDVGSGALAPTDVEDARVRRRMDIPQLDASIRRVTNGIGWDEGGRNMFERLSASLGEPDYRNSTQVNMEVSLIFQKFLGDAARSVCDRLMEREQGLSRERRSFLTQVEFADTPQSNQEAIDRNLSALVLTYHGQFFAPDSPKLEHWRWLFRSAHHTSGDTIASWRTVCVGLITHPHFYTY